MPPKTTEPRAQDFKIVLIEILILSLQDRSGHGSEAFPLRCKNHVDLGVISPPFVAFQVLHYALISLSHFADKRDVLLLM